MTRKERVHEFLRMMRLQYGPEAAYSAEEVSASVGASRANVSNDLNRLFEEGFVEKLHGRPVRYIARIAPSGQKTEDDAHNSFISADAIFDLFIGYNGSMRMEIEKAKAAVLYPPNGLPMLIQGETGVGKTMFARLLFEYAKNTGRLKEEARFISFNCADYANNPQLILSQLFGHVKGAFTGADMDKAGLVEESDDGVLFLDEVHRLPHEAQEMLFTLIDFGQYRRLGESGKTRAAHPMIILATTEVKEVVLLSSLIRRIPVTILFPPLNERSPYERLQLMEAQFARETVKLGVHIKLDGLVVKILLAYDCPGNIGQFNNDIKVICAKAYARFLTERQKELSVTLRDLPRHVKEGLEKIRDKGSEIELIVSNFIFSPDNDHGSYREQISVYDYVEQCINTLDSRTNRREQIEAESMAAAGLYFSNLLCGNYASTDVQNHGVFFPPAETAVEIMNRLLPIIRNEMDMELNINDQMAFAGHLDATVRRIEQGQKILCPFLKRIEREEPRAFAAAQKIADLIGGSGDMDDALNATGFITTLLVQIVTHHHSLKECCAIVVGGHDEGESRAMANAANEVLGGQYVKWLDAPAQISLLNSTEIIDAIGSQFSKKGGVLLTPSDDWKVPAAQAAMRYGVSIRTVANANTLMVIEAGILAYEHKLSDDDICDRLRLIENEVSRMNEQRRVLYELNRPQENKINAIITVCISGCGVAARLKKIIEKRFILPTGINILTMDMRSVKEFEGKLENILAVYNILCIVGVDIELGIGIPLISADDFILGNGRMRFANIVKPFGVETRSFGEDDYSSQVNEKFLMSGRRLSSYLSFLNGEELAPYVSDAIVHIERLTGGMERGKRIMLFLHICCMVERILFESDPSELEGNGIDAAYSIYADALSELCAIYRLKISNAEYEMIDRIMDLTFKH